MAGSRFSYVKNYEIADPLLPGTFILARVDGRAFHRFSTEHEFTKPNDERALNLMNCAARGVMTEFNDIILAFGESDEFRHRSFFASTSLYNRRMSKILTALTSIFTSMYMFHWAEHFPQKALKYPPSFDGRIILYPSEQEVRDYFAWRQVDTHINNLYNTAFWALVQQGAHSTADAHAVLRGTLSGQKHELLFSRFGINYNALPARLRKGTLLVRENVTPAPSLDTASSKKKIKRTTMIVAYHCDVVGEEFWKGHSELLNP
ncbi:tRNAHis guanylyltransferase [Punctularia strigosozonata HHB-11173 SS5]|uniref:tRNA(His) guanylyltransferase n=1 Tax=Punctularia strigosozonata (strain HHB-11173) TaxID=741275 RepID=R7S0P7_PUNST|nr:tRNAHis guanylyltransferase [Punctularia strigosozonata HHB-11173 SS5]EIN03965.1 tRNAHis guanylyltransferase [Punctularia strigosozonata HHB-11173 SS5]